MKPVLYLVGLAVLAGGPALAAPPEGLELEGEIGIVSDYRYRGYSLSDETSAAQAGLTVSAPGGIYAGAWASTIADYGGADVEVDLYAGWAGSAGGLDVDVALQRYIYPGGRDVDFWEVPVSVSRSWSAFTGTLGFAWAPEQDTLSEDNRYLYVAGEWTPGGWPVSLSASLGREDGAFADSKLDWAAGVTAPLGPVSLSLQYLDSDGPDSEAALVAGLKAVF